MIFNSQGDAKLRQYINGQTITPSDTAITLPKGAQLLGDVIIEAVDTEAIYQEGYNAGYEAGYAEGQAKPYSKELEYLESSGTQYIDTGFVPNQNTRVKVIFSYKSAGYIFASENAWKNASFDLHSTLCAYNNTDYQFGALTTNAIYSADFNKNNFSLQNGTTKTFTAATFSSGLNLYLFGGNRGGSLNEAMKGKIYSCKIYDNGAMVRDYIPVLNKNGVACLYDKVNKQFYYNAGTGTFSYAA